MSTVDERWPVETCRRLIREITRDCVNLVGALGWEPRLYRGDGVDGKLLVDFLPLPGGVKEEQMKPNAENLKAIAKWLLSKLEDSDDKDD